MRALCRLFAFLAVGGCLVLPARSSAEEMPEKVKVLISDLLVADKENLWPGYTPLLKPVAIHLKGKGAYLIGRSPGPKGCDPIKGFPDSVCFFRNKSADAVGAHFSAGYYAPEAGDVFLYNYAGKGVLDAEIIILHEMFHLYQHSSFTRWPAGSASAVPEKEAVSGYAQNFSVILEWWRQLRFRKTHKTSPVPDAEDVALAYVENKLLSGALLDRKNYRVLAAEFVRMREYRRAKLSEELLAFEKDQERIEGTAEYVCWKGIARRFSPLLAENYHAGMLLSPQPLANRDRRYYSPGAAQGFLLDRAGVSWQGRVQNGADISEIMRESFPPHHGVRDVKALLREFYSKWVQKALNIQARELAAKQRRVLASLGKYAGWKLVFRNDSDCNGQSRTCYDEDIDLGNGRTYLEACHIELRCKGVDISIDKAAIQGGRETTVLLGDNPRLSVKVDGTLRNPVPQSAAYHQLSIRAEGLMLDLARKGRINTSGNTIYVIPDPVNK